MKYILYILYIFLFIFFSNLNVYAINDTIVRFRAQRSTYVDNVIFRIEHNATDNFDGAYDASKMFSQITSQPQIWIVTPANEQVSINSFPFYTAFKSFNLGFKTTIADSITFSAYDFSRIDTNIRFYLKDIIANKIIDLRKDTLYKFYSGVVNNATRFRVFFASETTYSNGILDYGLPDSLVALKVLDGTMTISNSNLKAYNVNIEPNASLTLDANSSLYVENYFKIKSDTSGTGSFIQNGSLTLNNSSIVEKYLPNVTTSGWYISSSVESPDVDVLSGSDAVWFFNANDAQWQQITSGPLVKMKGYVTKFSDTTITIDFKGVLNNNISTVNLIRTSDFSGNFGWNLIANPYPSAINYDLIPPGDKVNLNNAIYFRKFDGDVAAYVDNVDVNGGSPIIPSMQAFWMQVELTKTTGSFSVTNACRVHSTNQQFKGSFSKSEDLLKIIISDGVKSDEAALRFKTDASNEFDKLYDASKMFSSNNSLPQVYTITPAGDNLAINALPFSDALINIPLGFYAANAASLNLAFSYVNNFGDIYKVVLEDSYNNTFTNLSDFNSYNFTTASGFSDDRFILHITGVTNNIIENKSTDINVYFTENQLTVSGKGFESDVLYEIYNALGQKIIQGIIPQNNTLFKKELNLEKGVYFISLFTKKEHLITNRKLIMW